MKTGRPPKPTGERLVSVTFNVPPAVREAIDRVALRERRATSAVLRDLVAATFPTDKELVGR